MESKDYEMLKRKLCKELEEIKDRKNMGMAEIEIIDKLTHAIKNIDYIMENEEGGSSYGNYRMSRYGTSRTSRNSYDGDSYADDGNSYRSRHYVRGHYSYADEDGMMMDKLEDLMDSNKLTLDEKSILRKAMDSMRR